MVVNRRKKYPDLMMVKTMKELLKQAALIDKLASAVYVQCRRREQFSL